MKDIEMWLKSRYSEQLIHANSAFISSIIHDYCTEIVKNNAVLPFVSISLSSDEEIREPIQNAIYATCSYTTDQCTEFADGILTYLNEAGYKVVRQ